MKKKLILFWLMIHFFIQTKSQTIAYDFTLTDVYGIQHNLYQTLDSGKVVVLDFFITNCGTCQINTPILDSIWNENNHHGDSLRIWGIECSGRNDSSIIAFMQQYHATYHFFSTLNDDVVTYLYNITYTPQYFVVCPNKIMKQVSINHIRDAISDCTSLSYDKLDHQQQPFIIFNNQIIFSSPVQPVELYSIQGLLLKTYYSPIIPIDQLKKGIYILKWKNLEYFNTYKLCIF
ncbi:MAG: TlpA family protein disulfide reductase [Bacteroidales bacterium]|nr:TlpA family protein disulfide reductase [Bacteroidales bacterium]